MGSPLPCRVRALRDTEAVIDLTLSDSEPESEEEVEDRQQGDDDEGATHLQGSSHPHDNDDATRQGRKGAPEEEGDVNINEEDMVWSDGSDDEDEDEDEDEDDEEDLRDAPAPPEREGILPRQLTLATSTTAACSDMNKDASSWHQQDNETGNKAVYSPAVRFPSSSLPPLTNPSAGTTIAAAEFGEPVPRLDQRDDGDSSDDEVHESDDRKNKYHVDDTKQCNAIVETAVPPEPASPASLPNDAPCGDTTCAGPYINEQELDNSGSLPEGALDYDYDDLIEILRQEEERMDEEERQYQLQQSQYGWSAHHDMDPYYRSGEGMAENTQYFGDATSCELPGNRGQRTLAQLFGLPEPIYLRPTDPESALNVGHSRRTRKHREGGISLPPALAPVLYHMASMLPPMSDPYQADHYDDHYHHAYTLPSPPLKRKGMLDPYNMGRRYMESEAKRMRAERIHGGCCDRYTPFPHHRRIRPSCHHHTCCGVPHEPSEHACMCLHDEVDSPSHSVEQFQFSSIDVFSPSSLESSTPASIPTSPASSPFTYNNSPQQQRGVGGLPSAPRSTSCPSSLNDPPTRGALHHHHHQHHQHHQHHPAHSLPGNPSGAVPTGHNRCCRQAAPTRRRSSLSLPTVHTAARSSSSTSFSDAITPRPARCTPACAQPTPPPTDEEATQESGFLEEVMQLAAQIEEELCPTPK